MICPQCNGDNIKKCYMPPLRHDRMNECKDCFHEFPTPSSLQLAKPAKEMSDAELVETLAALTEHLASIGPATPEELAEDAQMDLEFADDMGEKKMSMLGEKSLTKALEAVMKNGLKELCTEVEDEIERRKV